MKVAVLTICYNEEQFIGSVIKNWEGKISRHLVLLSSKPWHGLELPKDKTRAIAIRRGADVMELPWPSEAAQRNWGLGALSTYDYVLMVDADELYEEADQFKILEALGTNAGTWRVDNKNAYRIDDVVTYFKVPEYKLDPPDTHHPLIAVNPKLVTIKEHRIPSQDFMIPIPDVKMHHVSYLREDLRLYHKFRQFEHHEAVHRGWFANKWQVWTPEMDDVRAYGQEKSKAVPAIMPQEIRTLLEIGRNDATL